MCKKRYKNDNYASTLIKQYRSEIHYLKREKAKLEEYVPQLEERIRELIGENETLKNDLQKAQMEMESEKQYQNFLINEFQETKKQLEIALQKQKANELSLLQVSDNANKLEVQNQNMRDEIETYKKEMLKFLIEK